MKAEIIAVGTEILMGEIVNTNATFLAQSLQQQGYDVYYQTVVGDNQQRLMEVLATASKRSECIVLCGGLGPTEDDLTKEAVSAFLNEPLVLDEENRQRVHRYFADLQQKEAANNDKQSLYLRNGEILANEAGLAIGCYYHNQTNEYVILPGPPGECRSVFQKAIPLLKSSGKRQLFSRVLRFYGMMESELGATIHDLIDQQTNPTIATYAKQNEVIIRITAKSADKAQAETLLAPLVADIKQRLQSFYYGEGEDNSLAKEVVKQFAAKGKTFTAAESLTCGLFQSMIGDVSGASQVFPGGFVTYSAAVKEWLGVSPAIVQQYGTVSAECAIAMAKAARKQAQTDYAVSFTGVAGPDTLEGKPVGTIFVGLATPEHTTAHEIHYDHRTRSFIRHGAATAGLWLLLKAIAKN